MKLKIVELREYLRTSLWFLPASCVIVAFILAEVTLQFDRNLDSDGDNWFFFGGGTDSARSVVSTIAMSMLTFTGLVFTVTMLVLQLASNQLSPRVMRTFLRDRANQLILGIYIATFLYALLVLRRITSGPGSDPVVPALSVWVALLLVLLSVGLFIYYIHHMAQSIRPSSVMERVAAETRAAITRLYPSGIGESIEPPAELPVGPVSAIILSPAHGVVVGVDEERIVGAAESAGAIVELQACVGDFIREGAPLFLVRGPWDGSAEPELQASVSFGAERNMQQDAAFGFRQLVDIAARALSPGINDPTTAVQAIDQVHDLLGRLASRGIPSPRRDLSGQAAAILPRPGWPDYVALACDEIRRVGCHQIQVQRRLRSMLVDLQQVATPERTPPIEQQLALLDANLTGVFEGPELTRAQTPSAQGSGPSSAG